MKKKFRCVPYYEFVIVNRKLCWLCMALGTQHRPQAMTALVTQGTNLE